jgi:NAD(P)-dependent dehydrogenase (short-subunit alcohol dehydrogenase family)
MRLKGKVAIVTGAGQGLGASIADVLAREGAQVVLTGRTLAKVEKVADELKAKGYDVLAAAHEVTEEDSWKQVASDTVAKYGRIDILVNNAAIMAQKDILNCSADEMLNVFKTNCLAVMFGIQTVVPEMEKVGKGSIINIDSIGGLTSGDADGGDASYSASKGATRALTKHAAFNLSGKNIRVNSVHPGGILTPMLKSVFDATPALYERVKETSPLAPHVTNPEDVANGVLYLASEESLCVTGLELVIDCGYMTH